MVIVIESNPYRNIIRYLTRDDESVIEKEISYENNYNSKLISKNLATKPFHEIKDKVIKEIVAEYHAGGKLNIEFCGIENEYKELCDICDSEIISCSRGKRTLKDVNDIYSDVREICSGICRLEFGGKRDSFREQIQNIQQYINDNSEEKVMVISRLCSELDKMKKGLEDEVRKKQQKQAELEDAIDEISYYMSDVLKEYDKEFQNMKHQYESKADSELNTILNAVVSAEECKEKMDEIIEKYSTPLIGKLCGISKWDGTESDVVKGGKQFFGEFFTQKFEECRNNLDELNSKNFDEIKQKMNKFVKEKFKLCDIEKGNDSGSKQRRKYLLNEEEIPCTTKDRQDIINSKQYSTKLLEILRNKLNEHLKQEREKYWENIAQWSKSQRTIMKKQIEGQDLEKKQDEKKNSLEEVNKTLKSLEQNLEKINQGRNDINNLVQWQKR